VANSDNATYRTVNLFNWTGGVGDSTVNPLSSRPDRIVSGENAEISEAGISTRRGYSVMGAVCPAQSGVAAEVRHIEQVRFPTSEKAFLIAQVEESSGMNGLYVSPGPYCGASPSVTWELMYLLPSGADVVSAATLNDRATITEGKAAPPLVFAGCLDTSGEDWATPRAVLTSYNSGTDWHDITREVCDADPETCSAIGPLLPYSGMAAVCTDMPVVKGFRFEMQTGGIAGSSMIVEGFSGAWSPDRDGRTTQRR
jgi:hypothetical protein